MNRISRPMRGALLGLLLPAIAACFYFLRQEQAASHGPAVDCGLRAGIIVLALAGWFLSQSLIGSRRGDGAIGDGIHDLTAPLHRYLTGHPRCANAILMLSSALIDALGLFLIAASIFGPSIRPFAALLALFMMRQACQALCALPPPPGMIWRNPGAPSLLVTYDVANDFFFSGHTSIAVLGAIELARLGSLWLSAGAAAWVSVAAVAIAVFEAGVVLIFRAHYTMDIFAALVAAFCAEGMAEWLCAML
jgi:hypothetical protein